jgi:hypothetical protein
MFCHGGHITVIQPGTADTFFFQVKSERVDQVQAHTRVRAQTHNVSGVWRDLGFIEDNMKHLVMVIDDR